MTTTQATAAPTILSLLRDPANVCTVLGLVSGLAGIHLAVRGDLAVAAALGVVAVILDCIDGPVARRTPGRPPYMSGIGLQLDSLADVVCSGVGPAVLVSALAGWHPLVLVPAAVLVVASTVRLAYFNVFGLTGGSFTGLPVFYTPAILAALLLLAWTLAPSLAVPVAVVAVLVVAALHVSRVRVPKLRGVWFTAFMTATSVLTLALLALAATGGVR